ncbi:hypothetical protein [Silvimonas amylolytica]|uniref:TIR domain-containing protein n=1 Tax=Silvimonas amylolytica TaxID=449663 RepID=A0ABQ2PN84_9NEIS|nr:hypothetical protein [Silvimonas amylolytica]GGP26830.1 hypothetical protein GCM10010971_26490 [Silvimonas amylolytica]
MSSLKIFVSHTTECADLAKSLRTSLLALQAGGELDIRIHEEMPGGIDWRKWIEQNTRLANAFVFLYPHSDIDMGWPNFEVARFLGGNEEDRESKVVWIRNPKIAKMPAVFEPHQAYDATQSGIFKFFKEIFVDGLLTNGEPLNVDVNKPTTSHYGTANTIAKELAEKFAKAAVRPQYHTRRIQISLAYDKSGILDAEQSLVQGNSDGMKMIGRGPDASVDWATVRAALSRSVDWPAELEHEISAFGAGALPPSLSPFTLDDEIYIPVISKSEIVQTYIGRITVIFVAANMGRLRTMLEWKMPETMPGQIAAFVILVRLMLRVRYDVLEPRYQEAKFHSPSYKRRIEICEAVLAGFDLVRVESQRVGTKGLDAFYMIFDASLKSGLVNNSEDYLKNIKRLKMHADSLRALEKEEEGKEDELVSVLDDLLKNNVRWLGMAAMQFELFVKMWQ